MYKYRPWNENTKKIFTERKIWISRFSALNDPFEGDFSISLENMIKQKCKGDVEAERKIRIEIESGVFDADAYRDHVRLKLKRNWYAYCGSSDDQSILMWSHYADSHRGICLKLNISNETLPFLKNSLEINKSCIHMVEYSDKDLIYPESLEKDAFAKVLMTKYFHWSYEKEARILFQKNDSNSNGMELPFNSGFIKQVILGIRFPDNEIDDVVSIISKHKDKSESIQIFRGVQMHGRNKVDKHLLCEL